ncbi:MAG: hypothetical protein JXB48_16680 [Candidatus Latescibacteria bacterium]|nr:hypothetical protein [Candidatus Latescibacterota bacterium]
MKVILLTKKFNKNGERFVKKLNNSLNEVDIKVVYSLSDIFQYISINSLIIFHVDSHNTLVDILLYREKFEWSKIIIILPDEDENTIAKGLLLKPRFISTNDHNINDILAVINNIISNEKSKKQNNK